MSVSGQGKFNRIFSVQFIQNLAYAQKGYPIIKTLLNWGINGKETLQDVVMVE